MSPAEFLQRQSVGETPVLVDVREDWELEIAPPPKPFVHIPLGQLTARLGELDPGRETVVICRSGGRSLRAAQLLASNGFSSVHNLTGGMLAWSRDIDPNIPSY